MHIPEVSRYDLEGFDPNYQDRTLFFVDSQEPPLYAAVSVRKVTDGVALAAVGQFTLDELALNYVTYTGGDEETQEAIATWPLTHGIHEQEFLLRAENPPSELISHAARMLASVVLARELPGGKSARS